MINHTDLLNYLATTFNLQSYLEIGLGDMYNFTSIKSKHKIGVDPQIRSAQVFTISSDDFFSKVNVTPKDLIFIDGLHHADQVKRDFENSLRCLTDNGFIVIHDALPEKEEYTHVPRDSKIWNGDVYKFACSLYSYNDVLFFTIPIDHGCTVVCKRDSNYFEACPLTNRTLPIVKTFADFQQNKWLLNITTQERFEHLVNVKLNIHQLS